jgi:hypothetical protein
MSKRVLKIPKFRNPRIKTWLILFLMIPLVGIGIIEVSGGSSTIPLDNPSINSPYFNGSPTTLYLPVMKVPATSRPYNVFGVESYLTTQDGFALLDDTQAHWVHGIFVPWADVEPTMGARNWSAIATDEQKMRTAAENQFSSVVLVRKTPSWAQLYPGVECGSIHPSNLDEFATFMSDLVTRYSQYPYNVKYWEIWNEPDVAPSEVPANSYLGCWGDILDDYYGGGYYADMLKAIYPAIKAADPEAQVLIGGLLLACDPTKFDPGCEPSLFLEGILDNGGGDYFDGVGFHSYDYYNNLLGRYGNGSWDSFWDADGPVIIAKADYLRNLLSTYGVTGKFLFNLESAVLCEPDWVTCDSTFETTKAYYVAQAYAVSIAKNILGNSWYGLRVSFYGPTNDRNSSLIEDDLDPLPAYHTFKFASSTLRDSSFVRELTEFADVRGYVFDRGDRKIWVLWSADGADHGITLPSTPLAAHRIATDGTASSISLSTSLNVTIAPIFLEMN